MKVVLKDLTKKFSGQGKNAPDVIAVNNFNVEIPDGKLIGLLGPSGCGKSTALNLISGLLSPTAGRIFFGEDDVTDLPPENRGVGLVFLQNLKGEDKLSKEEMLARAYDAAKLVQIEGLMDRKPKALSGGQQQRVAIARALVKMPRVLLLDEPLSNLDARLRLQTREELKRIQQKTKITTIFVTHDQEEAMSISDMIIVMQSGVIQQIGRPQEVYDQPVNMFVAKFLGTPPINMFTGSVRGGRLFIGENDVLPAPGTPDGEYNIGIRPEGFIPAESGPLCCAFRRIEVMGRDTSVIFSHPAAEADTVRAIISSANKPDGASGKIRFALRPDKVFLFDKTDGKRIAFRAE